MKKIAIYGKIKDDNNIHHLKQILQLLNNHKTKIFLYNDLYELISNFIDTNISKFNTPDEITSDFFCLISLGGDGTLLDSITFIKNKNIPVLGINTGRLGFLAYSQKTDIETVINEVINNNFSIETRTIISITSSHEINIENNFALNEFVIQKFYSSSMITIHTYINSDFLNSYWADGLIISTPTGSTGYSLSCAGPIIHPECKNLVITPVSPHNLAVRPIIIPDNYKISVKAESRYNSILISLDSRTYIIPPNTEITIAKANFTIKLIKTSSYNYYKTIRDKLMWGIDKRN